MERELLACALTSRQDYELITTHIKVKGHGKTASYSQEFQVLLSRIGDYYSRDASAEAVNIEVLGAQIAEVVRSEKLVSRLHDILSEAAGSSVSVTNVREVVLLAQEQEVADKLAAALVGGDRTKADALILELQSLRANSLLMEEEEDDVLNCVDLAGLMESEYDPVNVIQIYPKSLNDRLDAGARKGHHLIVLGPVNMGKTAFNVNLGSGVAYQGKRCLHLINEDRAQDVYVRYVSNLSGMTKHEIRDAPQEANEKARARGLDNVFVKDIKPGTPEQIKHFIKKYEPEVVIVDQLRNLQMKAENRTNQLERAATEMRNIAKQDNVLMISVTQAADSARDKLVLDSGDVDSSNVGIPAQADLLIGIGADEAAKAEGIRWLSIIKNKISGTEDHFPVKINTMLSRYTNVG